MKIINVEQGTEEWKRIRMQKITGTKLKAVMGTDDTRNNLIAELISEEKTEQIKNIKVTEQMERGNAEEVFAIKAFEGRTGKKVDRVGVCVHDQIDWLALSPDGLIKNKDGEYTEAVEVKCPDTKNAVLYRIENMVPPLETGLAKMSKPTKANPEPEMVWRSGAPFIGVPSEYKWQVVNYFLVNEKLEKLYFVIYDARIINDKDKVYIVEVERNHPKMKEALIEAEEALVKFRKDWTEWKEIVYPTDF